ncbi:MAG: NPCBM/NEW2 domain-containing protein [Pirellulaceae bacterium]
MNAPSSIDCRWTIGVATLVAAIGWLSAASIASAQKATEAGPMALVLLDGQSVAIKSLAIAAGELSGDAVPNGLHLDDLRRIDLATPIAPQKANVIVELRGGGRVLGSSATIGDDKCLVEWSLGEQIGFPIDVVRAIRFEPAAPAGELDKAIGTPAADADRIFFKVDGKTDSVTGLIESLTAEQVVFQLEGQERTLPSERLFGIVFAQPLVQDEPTRCLLSLRDGSLLAGDLTDLRGATATLALPGGSNLELPWSAVSKVEVRSDRVAFLSDLKPIAVEERTLVTLHRPWQRDKSVSGKPLRLGSRTFDKGLGVHSRAALTFAAGREYATLAAVIGIDAETAGKGDCVFTVLGDGQPIFSKRMKGTDPPQDIQVDIGKFEQVTLLVEPGADLDLADHADWCEARMIKTK